MNVAPSQGRRVSLPSVPPATSMSWCLDDDQSRFGLAVERLPVRSRNRFLEWGRGELARASGLGDRETLTPEEAEKPFYAAPWSLRDRVSP